MSRVGLSKIKIPDGVTVTFIDGELTAKGKNGELSIKTHNFINIDINKDEVSFKTKNISKFGRSIWGTTRANVANVIEGVSKGFTQVMELNGEELKTLLIIMIQHIFTWPLQDSQA